jgi:hypothetical protein
MSNEELKLEIVKAVFPVYKDLATFMRVAQSLCEWIAPRGMAETPAIPCSPAPAPGAKEQVSKPPTPNKVNSKASN